MQEEEGSFDGINRIDKMGGAAREQVNRRKKEQEGRGAWGERGEQESRRKINHEGHEIHERGESMTNDELRVTNQRSGVLDRERRKHDSRYPE